MSELIIGMGYFNGHVDINELEELALVKVGRMLLEFCDAKHLCMAKTWFIKADKKKITNGSGCNKSEIDLCIMGKVDHKLFFMSR